MKRNRNRNEMKDAATIKFDSTVVLCCVVAKSNAIEIEMISMHDTPHFLHNTKRYLTDHSTGRAKLIDLV